jgi:hypothetical protein
MILIDKIFTTVCIKDACITTPTMAIGFLFIILFGFGYFILNLRGGSANENK